MSKLTEGMVIARTRATDLENVKRLNCWGSELTDVSLIRKLSNVEVLSLSVNNIKSLADFQYCHNLQELYIRKNQIKDIEDIWYLKELPKLRNLWLEDNPFVLPEELREAALYGLQLENPEDKNKNDFTFMSTSTSSLSHSSRSDNEHKNSRCTNNEYDIFNSNTRQQNRREEQMNRREEEINRREEQLRQEELDRRALQIKEEEYRRRIQAQKEEEQRKELERRSSQQTLSQYDANTTNNACTNESGTTTAGDESSGRASAIFGGFGGEPGSFSPPVGNRPVSNPLPDTNAVYQSRPHPVEIFKEEENANIRISNSQESNQMSYSNMTSSTHGRISPARPYPVRPKTRNSNILSAVLCLIKELDYASLEVVEMAVRCRMDELDD
uniref:U2A'/phosphoprotein 32 family A C-terminal domain-containing protein n=1 Tax=Strigamia maritima TaxID=126957 RepID=T1IUX8_STRMM